MAKNDNVVAEAGALAGILEQQRFEVLDVAMPRPGQDLNKKPMKIRIRTVKGTTVTFEVCNIEVTPRQ